MKVILLQDVAKLGRKYEMIKVSDGYAMNFLIPRGLAETTTPAKEKVIKKRFQEEKAKKDAFLEEISTKIKMIDKKHIIIKAKANEKGKLFAGLEKKDLLSYLNKKIQSNLEEKNIVLDEPIKSVGEYLLEVVIDDTKWNVKFIISDEK